MEPGQTGNRASGGITPAAGTPGQPTPEGQAEAQALTAAGGGRLDVLLEAARPDLYRLNGFRIAELPVDAGARDVSRRQQMVEMARETGLPIPPGPGRALPMNNASDPDVLAQAVQRLRDPERRLVDEFFWFWPHVLGQSKSDTALTALARGSTAAAGRIWTQQERTYSEANVSMHNLAVLAHATALDLEPAASQGELSAAKKQELGLWWQRAFERWRILLDHEAFWSRLSARIRDMDDQRLTTGTSRRLRATLPLALLSISAQLAVQAAESGASAEAKRHLRIMQESGFGAGVIDEALQRTIEPIRQRIKALCQNAPAEADADAVHADAVTRRFLDQAGALLSVLDCLLPAEHPTRQAMGDEVALTALRCQISYGNKTEDWQVSLELLQRTLPVAAGKAARERIQQNIRIVEGNRQVSMCWFCGKRRPDDGSGVEVKMYGNVQRTPVFTGGRFGTRLQWQQATIKVPRCTQCASAHSRVETFTGIGAVLGGVAGLAGCAAVASGEGQNAACGALGVLALLTSVGAGIGYGVGRASFPAGIKPVDAKIEFPVIVDKKKEGWQVGEKPSEANS